MSATKTVTEWCPHCDKEVGLKVSFVIQDCPSCKQSILPCAQCVHQNCTQCPFDEIIEIGVEDIENHLKEDFAKLGIHFDGDLLEFIGESVFDFLVIKGILDEEPE